METITTTPKRKCAYRACQRENPVGHKNSRYCKFTIAEKAQGRQNCRSRQSNWNATNRTLARGALPPNIKNARFLEGFFIRGVMVVTDKDLDHAAFDINKFDSIIKNLDGTKSLIFGEYKLTRIADTNNFKIELQ